MAHDWNENTYTQQFDGSLRRGPKSRPVAVTTHLHMMNQVRLRAKFASTRNRLRERRNTC